MKAGEKQRRDRILDSYIDRILSMQDDRMLNLFDSGIMLDLKVLQKIALKKVLKALLKQGKITVKKKEKTE